MPSAEELHAQAFERRQAIDARCRKIVVGTCKTHGSVPLLPWESRGQKRRDLRCPECGEVFEATSRD